MDRGDRKYEQKIDPRDVKGEKKRKKIHSKHCYTARRKVFERGADKQPLRAFPVGKVDGCEEGLNPQVGNKTDRWMDG